MDAIAQLSELPLFTAVAVVAPVPVLLSCTVTFWQTAFGLTVSTMDTIAVHVELLLLTSVTVNVTVLLLTLEQLNVVMSNARLAIPQASLLPLLIWLFGLSLRSSESFEAFKATVGHPVVKLVLLGLLWAYLHHFCMGIRILLIDIHVGVEKAPARASALAVLVVSLALTVILGAKLW